MSLQSERQLDEGIALIKLEKVVNVTQIQSIIPSMCNCLQNQLLVRFSPYVIE